MINPVTSKIGDLLNSAVHFVVPKYQREYAWGKSEATEFMTDLESSLDSPGAQVYLGTLIFHVTRDDPDHVKIVDGQQRLTTVMLLLIACKNAAKRLNAIKLEGEIQKKITYVDPTTAESLGCRLIASESVKDVFEYIANSEWDETFPVKLNGKQVKRQVNRLRPIYQYLFERVSGYDQATLSKFLKAIYDAYIVRIDISDELEAFDIFERTNARGMDLEVSDLLKNYLFSKGVANLQDRWDEIIANADGNVLRMLKYFYVSQHGYVMKSELYKNLQQYGKHKGADTLVSELEEFSNYYDIIRNADKDGIRAYFDSLECPSIAGDQYKAESIYIALEGLRLFKMVQVYPLIYAAIRCFKKCGGGSSASLAKSLMRFFAALEAYHFINTAICGRMGNEIEIPYADYCDNYSKSDDFAKTTEDLLALLKKKLATEEEFRTRFADIYYSKDSISQICYIFDRITNYGRDPGQRVRIFNPDQKLLRKNHNIEHFFPQSPESEQEGDKETLAVGDYIGNLLVISFRTNSKLGNLRPDKKIEKLQNELLKEVENLSYVQEFIKTYGPVAKHWNQDAIAKRAEDLSKDAYNRIWKIA